MKPNIDTIVLNVYRARLDASCKGDADRQVKKDGDGGEKQRRRADFYRPLVMETLKHAGVKL